LTRGLSRPRNGGNTSRVNPRRLDLVKIDPALIGKSGELLVAAELMRRGVEVAYPASDVGIDLLAYRLVRGKIAANKFVPIQVKTRSASGYFFQKDWFDRAPGLVLVHVWWVSETPEFYVFQNLEEVEEALGSHAKTGSWQAKGGYSVTEATKRHDELMRRHKNKWKRIIDQLPASTSSIK
jgi:hypothetical protein